MPQWIDLHAHGVALLARNAPDGRRELVLHRLRSDAQIPIEAQRYGFEPEGGIYVRRDPRFNLREIRAFFPQAVVREVAIEDIAWREASSPAEPSPSEPGAESPPASAPAPSPVELAERLAEVRIVPPEWADVPRPRFRMEATLEVEDGHVVVVHGQQRFRTERQRASDGAKDEVHREAVGAAYDAGVVLPFAVLVDYPGLAALGRRPAPAEARVAGLLSQLGIAEKLMGGEDAWCRLSNDPYMDLTIERHAYPDGDRLFLTHYREQGGDKILDAEMVFAIRRGRLFLAETAVENVLRGGELRGCDTYFANMFSKNLLDQGFAQAKVTWPDDPMPVPVRDESTLAVTATEDGISIVPVQDGLFAGMFVATDAAGTSETVQHGIGAHPHAAIAAMAPAPAAEAHVPRAIGENLLGQVVLDDGGGQRSIERSEGLALAPLQGGGIEFLTEAEAVEQGLLVGPDRVPLSGAFLLGRTIAAAWRDGDARVCCAVERRGGAGQATEYFGYRMTLKTGAEPAWESLGKPWSGGPPSAAELRMAIVRPADAGFDPHALMHDLNQLIEAANLDIVDERYKLSMLSADDIVITQPEPYAYEVRAAQRDVPVEGVRIVQRAGLWQAMAMTNNGTPHSGSAALETAFGWAARYIGNQRGYYLSHLHRMEDGQLRIGVPQDQFDTLKFIIMKASRGEQVGGPAGPWEDFGVSYTDTALLSPRALGVAVSDDGHMRIEVKAHGLSYDVFALERHAGMVLDAQVVERHGWGVGSVRSLLQQIHRDIQWAMTLSTHPNAEQLRAWEAFYQAQQAQHYPGRHELRLPSAWARELALDLANRDVDRLLELMGRTGNPSSKALFEHAAGVSLGTNRTTREAAVYGYCGYTPEQAQQHRQQRDAQAKVRSMEREVRDIIKRVEGAKISYDGETMSQKAFIDRVFSEGFTQLTPYQRGAATRYALSNQATRSSFTLKEPMTSYVRHLIALRDTAAPVHEPDDRPALTA